MYRLRNNSSCTWTWIRFSCRFQSSWMESWKGNLLLCATPRRVQVLFGSIIIYIIYFIALNSFTLEIYNSFLFSGQGGSTSWSEIASCSYEARQFGCHNGMMLNQAKKLCPSLVCVPYQFDEYRSVSQKFYEVLASFSLMIEAVSCDEALMDISRLVSVGMFLRLA